MMSYKSLSDKKKYPKCDVCGYRHKNYEDGFDYLSCMLEIKRNGWIVWDGLRNKRRKIKMEEIKNNPQVISLTEIKIELENILELLEGVSNE